MEKSPPRNQDKGKGRETVPQDASGQGTLPRKADSGGSSILGRIGKSTAMLTSSMLNGPPSTSDLASSSSRSGKLQPLAVGVRNGLEGERSIPIPDVRSRPPYISGEIQAHAAAEDVSFRKFLDGTDTSPHGPATGLEQEWQAHIAEPSDLHSGYTKRHGDSVAEQQRQDGHAVVALLSDPEDLIFEDETEDTISPTEFDSLRKALFRNSSGLTESNWENMLNFVPQYLQDVKQAAWRDVTQIDRPRDPEIFSHAGLSNPDEAWQLWVDQWSDVLTRYTDEVWGDLTPLVVRARAEVEQLQTATQGEEPAVDTPALRRLRAILGHLHGSRSL